MTRETCVTTKERMFRATIWRRVRSARPSRCARATSLAHYSSSFAHERIFSALHVCRHERVCAGRECTQNRVHAAKNSERSQRCVPASLYLELKNSTNRAYSRARPIRSPSFFPSLPSFLPAATKGIVSFRAKRGKR